MRTKKRVDGKEKMRTITNLKANTTAKQKQKDKKAK